MTQHERDEIAALTERVAGLTERLLAMTAQVNEYHREIVTFAEASAADRHEMHLQIAAARSDLSACQKADELRRQLAADYNGPWKDGLTRLGFTLLGMLIWAVGAGIYIHIARR